MANVCKKLGFQWLHKLVEMLNLREVDKTFLVVGSHCLDFNTSDTRNRGHGQSRKNCIYHGLGAIKLERLESGTVVTCLLSFSIGLVAPAIVRVCEVEIVDTQIRRCR